MIGSEKSRQSLNQSDANQTRLGRPRFPAQFSFFLLAKVSTLFLVLQQPINKRSSAAHWSIT